MKRTSRYGLGLLGLLLCGVSVADQPAASNPFVSQIRNQAVQRYGQHPYQGNFNYNRGVNYGRYGYAPYGFYGDRFNYYYSNNFYDYPYTVSSYYFDMDDGYYYHARRYRDYHNRPFLVRPYAYPYFGYYGHPYYFNDRTWYWSVNGVVPAAALIRYYQRNAPVYTCLARYKGQYFEGQAREGQGCFINVNGKNMVMKQYMVRAR